MNHVIKALKFLRKTCSFSLENVPLFVGKHAPFRWETCHFFVGKRFYGCCNYSLTYCSMETARDIIIGDQSALHALMHRDWSALLAKPPITGNPFANCDGTIAELRMFNTENALYGEKPITLLVPPGANRRFSNDVTCRYAPLELSNSTYVPVHSLIKLRSGLYLASPELVYLRMAEFSNLYELAAIGTNLCGRYYIDELADSYPQRSAFITTPSRLRKYCGSFNHVRGCGKALQALEWVKGNSGSPAETQLFLLLTIPTRRGGFGLPFDHLNHDVTPKSFAPFANQSNYSIDIANIEMHVGVEYDGQLFHDNPEKDKRRRNELKALGWDIFPIGKDILWNPERAIQFAHLLAKRMKIRFRPTNTWHNKYLELRRSLGLNA